VNPKQFLTIGGAVLLLVGILGFIGIIGPDANSIFGSAWYFDNAENIA
jgi:ABC-type Fe3+-siderophore transport system permease subunit